MQRRVIFPRSLQYLLAIAEHRSFTRAAEALHVSQPTLSQQIKQLESSLQSLLLDRSGRTVRLTDAGEIYLRHALRAREELAAGRRAINDVKNLSRGSLRVGWTPITDYLTCTLLETFSSRYPGITLSTFEMPQDDIELAVAEDKIDFGIAFGKSIEKESRSGDIGVEVLFQDNLCLAVGNAHPRAEVSEKINIKEFEKESLALLNSGFALRSIVDRYCLENRIKPRVSVESNSLNVIIEFIQIGKLSTVLPQTIVHSQCGIHPIELSPNLPSKAITLSFRNGGYTSPACEAFKKLAPDWAMHRDLEAPLNKQKACLNSEQFLKY
jgi:LysR family cyn operon transcriptional activator